jgi:hypothetical protein
MSAIDELRSLVNNLHHQDMPLQSIKDDLNALLDEAETMSGGVRRLDLGIITPADLASTPPVLYTPSAGEIVGPVILADLTFADLGGLAIQITRQEQIDPDIDPNFPPLAAWDSDLARDAFGWTKQNAITINVCPVTTGPIGAAFASQVNKLPSGVPWQSNTIYTTDDLLVVANHLWSGGGGTSGGSEPDFAGNVGGSVVDNDITWFDEADLLTATGSAHVYADVVAL